MSLFNKPLPNHKESEKIIISQLIHQVDDFYKITEFIKPEYFFDTKYRFIYESILKTFEQHKTIDRNLLNDQIKKTDPEFIIDFMEFDWGDVGLGMNTGRHALQMQKSYKARQYINAAIQIIQCAYNKEPDEIAEIANKTIYDVSVENTKDDDSITLKEAAGKINEFLSLNKEKGQILGVPTGYKKLDSIYRGWRPGQLIVIGARPGVGKSLLMSNLAVNAAKTGKAVAIFTLEMSWQELMLRITSNETGLSNEKLENYDLDQEKGEGLILLNGLDVIHKLKTRIIYRPKWTIHELMNRARREKIRDKTDIIFIDYLQLMTAKTKRPSDARYLEVGEITRQLKELAMELQIPIVALCQLSRELEKRTDKRPQLYDLRESGSIEQDADVVLFLYRDAYYNKETEFPDIAEINIAKYRNKPTGMITLKYDLEISRFWDDTND